VGQLRRQLAGSVEELSALLGRPFEEWTTTIPSRTD
jgi:hypothetical protein